MAKITRVELTDDTNGGPADDTVLFGLDGQEYAIDLSAANAQALRKAFAPYVESARRQRGAVRLNRSARFDPVTEASISAVDRKHIQAFAAAVQLPVPKDQGRISPSIVDSWISAGKPRTEEALQRLKEKYTDE